MPARKQQPTYLLQLDELPPYKCWMLARRRGGIPITQQEIRRATGWNKKKVEKMCGLKTWAEVPVMEADQFRAACGVNRANERRHRYYLSRTLDLTVTACGLSHCRKRPVVANKRLIRIATTTTGRYTPTGGSP